MKFSKILCTTPTPTPLRLFRGLLTDGPVEPPRPWPGYVHPSMKTGGEHDAQEPGSLLREKLEQQTFLEALLMLKVIHRT
jgi:hypothetical protein